MAYTRPSSVYYRFRQESPRHRELRITQRISMISRVMYVCAHITERILNERLVVIPILLPSCVHDILLMTCGTPGLGHKVRIIVIAPISYILLPSSSPN